MTRTSFVAPLVVAVVATASSVAWPARAWAQAGPDDEPLPPALMPPPGTTPSAPAQPALPPPSPPIVVNPGLSVAPVEMPRAASPDPAAGFLPTLDGPIGLYRVSTAEVGPVQHLRFALHGRYFRSSDFLIEGDTNTRLDGAFTFGFTPHESIELFGGIFTASNRNQRPDELGRRDPELIKSFGDLILGGKGVLPVGRGFTAGAELGFRFLSSISDLSFSASSTSLWIGPVATLDLRKLANAPLRFHLNASFYLDNSSNLYDFSGTTPHTQEAAMFAYGIVGSRLRFALGADAPLERLPVPLRPFVEYHAEIITESKDPAFSAFAGPTNKDQHWLTFGLRARVLRALTLDAGMDVGLRSVGFEYGTPIAPWAVIFGVSYPIDIEALNRPIVVTKTVEGAAAPATTGTVTGSVRATDGKPVPDAVVAFGTYPRSRVVSDADGGFQSGPLPPGPVEVVVSAVGFEAGKASAVVAPGAAATVQLALTRKIATGNVRGKVSDRGGRGVGATLRFSGAATFEAHADASGAFSAALPVGPYKVVVEAPGFPNKEVPLDIAAGQDKQLEVALRPSNPDVILSGENIVLRLPIKFRPGVPKLDPAVKVELEGVADLLVDHPEVKTLRIEAHWNGSGPGPAKKKGAVAAAKQLTKRQANTVRDYLIAKGVSASRVEAVGHGSDVPLVPNLGPASQVKNRRVDLVVVQ